MVVVYFVVGYVRVVCRLHSGVVKLISVCGFMVDPITVRCSREPITDFRFHVAICYGMDNNVRFLRHTNSTNLCKNGIISMLRYRVFNLATISMGGSDYVDLHVLVVRSVIIPITVIGEINSRNLEVFMSTVFYYHGVSSLPINPDMR